MDKGIHEFVAMGMFEALDHDFQDSALKILAILAEMNLKTRKLL